jgi:hypothetical protein
MAVAKLVEARVWWLISGNDGHQDDHVHEHDHRDRASVAVYTGSRHATSWICIHRVAISPSSRDGAERARRGDPGAKGAGLCTILQVNFREFLFYALR